jgi:AraC family transcriptional regulator
MPPTNTRASGVVSYFLFEQTAPNDDKIQQYTITCNNLATPVTFLGSMILKEFPDLTWLRSQAERRFADGRSWSGAKLATTGWPNVILNVSADNIYRDKIRGPLSLFTNISGESIVEISRRRIPIKEDFFFLSNYDQHYTLEIEKGKRAETFNIHFGDYFCDQVFSSLSQKPDQLLNSYFQEPSERLEFHNRIYHRDEPTQKLIMEIRHGADGSAWLEEKLYALIENLLKKEKDLIRIQSRFPALKSSTREEVLRRMLIVSDYIHTHLNEDLSLEQLANVGCFSKFHFLRLFKIAFNKTPYQFINEERVRMGRQMIERTRISINEIAHSLGFMNPSSFSRMFFNHTGLYPTQLRPAYH